MNNMTLNSVFSMRLDWNLTTETVFSLFSDSPWAILLDSANAKHIDAKYDVICVSPIATLVRDEAATHIRQCADRAPLFDLSGRANVADVQTYTHLAGDPFQHLNDTLTSLYPHKKDSNLPFSGGAMGSFSYDLGRNIEQLPTLADDDIQLPLMNIGFYDWALVFDYQQQAWTLVHYHSQQALVSVQQALEARLQSLTVPLQQKPSFQLTTPWSNQIDAKAYQQKFEQVQHYLHSGDCYQINLTQRFSSQYRGDEWQAYLALRQSNAAPFSAFMRLTQHAILSISPERFICLNGDQIQTKPIKGTMPRDSDPVIDTQLASQLAHSDKDRAENLMIVDLLRNDIGKVASAGSVNVPHLFDIESFPAVHHLVSTITATLRPGLSGCDLLKACFPGGSITGAPKIRAMAIIEELEPSRRSLYCGSMGYISQDGNMDSSITIRTLVAEQQTDHNRLYCWAGGGIVADSKVTAEYQETFDKVSKILPILSHLNTCTAT